MISLRGWAQVAGLVAAWAALSGCGGTSNKAPTQEVSGTSGTSGAAGADSADTAGGRASGEAGASEETVGGAAGAAGAAGAGCHCDDGIACTADACVDGQCQHQALHFECDPGHFCSLTDGCSQGAACAKAEDCVRFDSCVTATCDAASARCVYTFLDSDHDGRAPQSCGGNDCNDADADIYAEHGEVCDGKDNDCDGELDPLDGSGCAEGMVCLARACQCPSPSIGCAGPQGQVCIDPRSDHEHCGSCGNACADTEECVDNACKCSFGNNVCGNFCVDLQTNPQNCGKCGAYCGSAACVAGECTCPADTLDCGTGSVPACTATATDEQNCGGCGERCLDAGLCSDGACDTSVEWLKIYRAQVTPYYGQGVGKIEADAGGNLYVAATADVGAYTLYPNGQATLWNGPGVIAKFAADGSVLWAVDSSTGIYDLAVLGSDVWASVYEIVNDSITIAGKKFSRKPNYQAFTAVVKLNAATGELVDSFQLDYATGSGGSEPMLAHDASHVWLAQSHNVMTERAGAPWTPPKPGYNTFVYPLGAAEPVWFHGILLGFTVDATGKPVLSLAEMANETVNFGGADIPMGSSNGGVALRLTNQLAHDVSFANYSVGNLLPNAAGFVGHGGSGTPILQKVDDTGTNVTVLVQPSSAFSPGGGLATPGHFALFGYTNGSELDGRAMPFGANAFVTFSDTTFALERAMAFWPNRAGGGHGGVLSLAMVDGGKSAVLLVRLQNGLTIHGQEYDLGSGNDALALIKVKL